MRLRRGAQVEELKRKTLVVTIQHGLPVEGIVLDDTGKPVAGAEVGQDGFGLISATSTDDAGRFKLRGVAPGNRQVAAKANGFAPQLREATVQAGMKRRQKKLCLGILRWH